MNKEEFLKIFKNKNNRLIWLILIIGVVLMAAAGGYKKDSAAENTAWEVSIADDERRLEEILSQIEGAGEVKVMI
ncbi:MAG: hypothetical protein LUF26_02420, partial [Firmicutes bacterium]|nr:hypothetical protein [Bacillota bacterium]